MIDYLVGLVQESYDQEIVICAGIVGLRLHIPRTHGFVLGGQAKVYIYMHWNTEAGPSLYGFSSSEERSIFALIISCPGVGPKLGLSILSDLGAENFLQAIQTADEQSLSKVSGIGRKKAEHIIVALKHKITALVESGEITLSANLSVMHIHDISQALQSLNYSRAEVNQAIDFVRISIKTMPEVTFDQLLRQALLYLSKQM